MQDINRSRREQLLAAQPRVTVTTDNAERLTQQIDWMDEFDGLDEIDIASALSFPASDPPAFSPPPFHSHDSATR